MDAIDAVMTRRSVRAYLDRSVEREKIEMIVDAGRRAASGMNSQGWHFSVISNKEAMRKLDLFITGNEKSFFYDAPLLIITSYDASSPYGPYDTSCALENMMIAANALGLGSVWINRINHDDEKALRLSEFGIPEGYRAFGCLAVGYAADEPKEKVLRKGTVTYIE